ncbi:hypothetical protein P7C71_g6464, partial [Lecanoromycetidae sp. Uapishka_2]
MSWFSILPAHLNTFETWIARFFLLLGVMTIGPWALFLVYDMILYVVRAVYYEIPYYGGRASGRRRPRAPTLTERPNGRRRTFSISEGLSSGGSGDDKGGLRKRRSSESSGDEDMITEEG